MADTGARSEDVLGLKWDRCLKDTFVKFGTGVALGIVVSALFLKRRPWPVALGAGIGLGMGYSNCQHDIQKPYLMHGSLQIEKKPVETS